MIKPLRIVLFCILPLIYTAPLKATTSCPTWPYWTLATAGLGFSAATMQAMGAWYSSKAVNQLNATTKIDGTAHADWALRCAELTGAFAAWLGFVNTILIIVGILNTELSAVTLVEEANSNIGQFASALRNIYYASWIVEGTSLLIAKLNPAPIGRNLDIALGFSWVSIIPATLAWLAACVAVQARRPLMDAIGSTTVYEKV